MPSESLGALLYEIGIDLPALRTNVDAIEQEFLGLTEAAKRSFGGGIARELANALDPKLSQESLVGMREQIEKFGKDAVNIFDQALGRKRARQLFAPMAEILGDVSEDGVDRLNRVLKEVGLDLPKFQRDAKTMSGEFNKLSVAARKTFGRNIGREIASSIDPQATASQLAKIRAELARFGKDAVRTFDQTFGKRAAKKIFDPLRDESQTFIGQLKKTIAGGFDLKNIALGSAAGIGLATLAGSLITAGKAAIQFAADFELALAKVQSIADEDFNVRNVSDNIKNLAREVPQDLVTLTTGLGDIIGSGITKASEALNVLEVSAKAAVAGLTDTATASRGIVFVLNAYGKSAEEAAGISDVLFKTVDEGVITFQELTANIGDVAGPAAQAGVEIGEIGAAIAFLTKQGISGAESVTALRNLLTRIINPAEGAKQAAKELGIELSLAGVRAAGGFTNFIKQVQEATRGDIVQIQKIFPEERAFRAASRLAGEVGAEFQRLSGIFTDTAQTAGATERAFNIINQTADQQFKLLKNNLSVAVVELGQNLLNLLMPAMRGLNELFSNRTELDKTIDRLRELGVAAEKLQFLELQNNSQKAQKELKELDRQFAILSADIDQLGLTSLGLGRLNSAVRSGARAILNEFRDIIKTSEGIVRAQERLNQINKEFGDVALKIESAKSGQISLSRQELVLLYRQRDSLESQAAALNDLLVIGEQYVALQDVVEKSNKEILGLETKNTQAKSEQIAVANRLLDLTKSIGLAAKDFSFLQAQEQQQQVLQSMGAVYQQQIKLNEAAKEFITSQSTETAKKLSSELLGQGVTLKTIAAAETRLNLIREQARAILKKRDDDEKSGIEILAGRKKLEEESLAALSEQAGIVQSVLGFLRTQLNVTKEQKQESLNVKKLSTEQLQEQLELLRQNKEANAATINEIEKELDARKKATELQKQALDFITQARKQIEVLNASTDLEKQIIQIRQQTEERKKMFGVQSQAAQAALDLESAQFRNLLNERLRGAESFEEKLAGLKIRDTFEQRRAEIKREYDEEIKKQAELRDIILANQDVVGDDREARLAVIKRAEENITAIRLEKEKQVQLEIAETIQKLADELALAKAPSTIQRELAEIKLKYDRERKLAKGNAEERAEQVKFYNKLEQEEFQKTIKEFERELSNLDRKRFREFLMKFTINGELKFNVDEILSQAEFDKLPQEIKDFLLRFKQPFSEFNQFLSDEALGIAANFTNLIAIADRGAAQFIDSLLNLAEALQSKNIVGIIGAGVDILGGLFGSARRSAEEERRRIEESLAQQKAASEDAAQRSRELISALKDLETALTGPEASAQDLIGALAGITAGLRFGVGVTEDQINQFAQVMRQLKDLNIDPKNFADLFFQISQLALFDPNAAAVLELLRGIPEEMQETVFRLLAELGIALEGIDNFGQQAASISGILGDLQFEFDLFNIDNPIDQLNRFREEIKKKFGAELAGDVAGLRDFITQGFAALREGGEGLIQFLSNMNLEELTADELRVLLQELSGFADEIDDTVTPKVSKSLDDLIAVINRKFDLLDITNAQEKLDFFLKQFSDDFGVKLPGNLNHLREFVRQGVQAFVNGGVALEKFLERFDLQELTIDEFENLLLELQGLLSGFGFSSVIDRLNLEFDLLNITDPIEKLSRFREAIKKQFGAVLPETEEGVKDFISRGLDAFLAGGKELKDFLAEFNLEELTADEFRELLLSFSQFNRDLGIELGETSQVLVDAFDDLMKELQLEFDLFNIDNPVEQLDLLAKAINKKFGAILPQTEKGISDFVRKGFDAIKQGEEAVLALLAGINLEELTVDQFKALLLQLSGLAEQAGFQVDEINAASKEIRTGQVKSITFAQGNKLLDEIQTIRVVVTNIFDSLRGDLVSAGFDLSGLQSLDFGFDDIAAAVNISSDYQHGILNQAITTNQILRDILYGIQNGGVTRAPVNNYYIVNGETVTRTNEDGIATIDRELFKRANLVQRASGLL